MPLSQFNSEGPRGECSVCHGKFRLLKDGTLYRHGGKVKGSHCTGSCLSPASGIALVASQSISVTQTTDFASTPSNPSTAVVGKAKFSFLSEGIRYRLIDHIPKSARASSRSLLTTLIEKVLTDL